MFKIEMELSMCGSEESITVCEEGEMLAEMNLKKDIKGRILRTLIENKTLVNARYDVSLLVEKDGEYYDHDDLVVDVKGSSVKLCY